MIFKLLLEKKVVWFLKGFYQAAVTGVSSQFYKSELVLFDNTLNGKGVFSSLLQRCELEE